MLFEGLRCDEVHSIRHSPAVDPDHNYTRYVETYTTRNDGIGGRQVQGARFVLDAVNDERGVRFVPLVPVQVQRDRHKRDQGRQQPDDDDRPDGNPACYPAAISGRRRKKKAGLNFRGK